MKLILLILLLPLAITNASGQRYGSALEEPETTTTTSDEPTSTALNSQDDDTCSGLTSSRLPAATDLSPDHYELTLAPRLETQTFDGLLEIRLHRRFISPGRKWATGSPAIVLHASESIELSQVELDGQQVANESICRDPDLQLLVITPEVGSNFNILYSNNNNNNSQIRNHTLKLLFSGKMASEEKGLFNTLTFNSMSKNQSIYHAATQLQATEARQLFPCFDEPTYKATFNLSLVVVANQQVVSNTELIDRRPVDFRLANQLSLSRRPGAASLELVRFRQTPPMSSYLLAFVLGEFERLEERKLSGLKLGVLTPEGRKDEGRLALEVASRGVDALEAYLGLPYPLSKLDLVSVRRLSGEAMENWGLLVFREPNLLIDLEYANSSSRALVISTIFHELAHQWFGNLVTMSWWNEVWLNEGFATWLEYKLADELYPELARSELLYLTQSHVYALAVDEDRTAHAVEPRAELVMDDGTIDDLFDAISYNKAAALLRICHDELIGARQFHAAIVHYLGAHKYSNARTPDLWSAIEHSVGIVQANHTRTIMQSWLTQPGHPLVKARLRRSNSSSSAGGSSNLVPKVKLILEQSRYLRADNLSQIEQSQLWIIPINIILGSYSKKTTPFKLVRPLKLIRTTLSERHAQIELPDWFGSAFSNPKSSLSSDEQPFLKLNANFTGFYRVQYHRDLLDRLEVPVRNQLLPVADRLNLLDDLFTLAGDERLPIAEMSRILSWFEHEPNRVLQEAVDSVADQTDRMLQNSTTTTTTTTSPISRANKQSFVSDNSQSSLCRPKNKFCPKSSLAAAVTATS